VAFGPVSTDLYLPSLPAMQDAFGVDVGTVQLTLSVFLAGFAVAQLIYGPLSDRHGRRPTLIAGIVLFFAASLICAFAPSIEVLLSGRFFQAVGAGAGPVLGRAIVRDLFDREEGARVLAFMSSAMALAPMVAPIIGGQLHVAFGWRANFIALAVLGAVALSLVWRMVQETNRYADPSATQARTIAANFRVLLRNREFLGYTLSVMFSYGALFAFISGSSFVLIGVLEVPPQYFGFCFASVVIGYVSGAFAAGKLARRIGVGGIIRFGSFLIAFGGVVLAGLAWAGVSHVLAVILPMSVVFCAVGFVMPTSMAASIAPFPKMAGAASSLMGFCQLSSGALVGFAVGHLHDGTTRPMATIIGAMAILTLGVYAVMIRPRTAV
ncbi:MAG: multidrug effflux MFS transporter, partial [Rhodospirillales bacterium]|nr:multidrug effflux MFS transporter [Rhodospirillales bacterium]